MLDTFRKATPEALAEIATEKELRQTQSLILLPSMGSQFDHLIFQQVSKLGVYCQVADPAKMRVEDVEALKPTGIIVSGGPASVHSEPPPFDERIFDLGIPVLGICLGFQMWAQHVGVKVIPSDKREFGRHDLIIRADDPLFENIPNSVVLQSHGDRVSESLALKVLAGTDNCPIAAAQYRHLRGVQFHPEVSDTEYGQKLFENFCFRICGITDTFPAEKVAERKVEELRAKIEGKTILLAISGGSDSSVAAYTLKKAAQGLDVRIHGVYIKGVDRADDEAHVYEYFGNQSWMTLETVDVTEQLLPALKGVTEFPEKRLVMKKIGYCDVLQERITEHNADFLMEGTLYTDLVESGEGHATGARRAVIKTHHNTGNTYSVPLLLPLSDCVKDNARDIGRELGVPEVLLVRHPFPGPGRLLRIEDEITREKLEIEGKADEIFIEELRRHGLYEKVWQAAAVVQNSRHTTTKGDDGGGGWVVALWAVWSVNGFTATAAELPWDFIKKVTRRIGNEIRGVGAVTYRTSDKPFSTIEWG